MGEGRTDRWGEDQLMRFLRVLGNNCIICVSSPAKAGDPVTT
jgi:hypothetical protein